MKRKYAKVAVALAATVTITAPGVGVPGNSGTVMAAEQTGNVQELNSITESQKEIVTGSSDIDNEAPVVTSTSVSPENSQVYHGAKTFTFETSEPIQSPGEDWKDVSDKKDGTKWAKEFATNQKFTLTLTDLAGNTVTTDRYEVKNIETETLVPQVTYSTTDPTKEDVTVTVSTGAVECQTPEGWTRAESNKKNLFQKVYTGNTEETVTFVSLGGQQVPVEIKISNIDKEAPQLVGDISFTPDNSQMSLEKVVSFEANEAVVSPGEGWTEVEGSNGTKWQKVYQQAMKDSIILTDLAGNTSEPINFEVKRIENTELAAEVIYSNEGQTYTNQDVTVTIKTSVECQTPEGWKQTGNKRNQFEKTFSADAEETVPLVSLAGQNISQQISVKGIDKEAPKAYVNGTEAIDESIVYNDGVSLKFSDNAALDRYELNGKPGPTSIAGNKWGDGNLQNIKGSLVDGVNTLVVWDMAGNSSEYQFTVDLNIPQTVGVNYYIPAEDRYVEGQIVVDDDATTVDPTTLTDIPEGYEVISTDAAQINDGWIYVELQQIVTTKEVGVNYYIPAEDRYVEGKVVVDKDATTVDLAALTDIPEGYEVISTDAAQINDGWIYVELQQIVTTKEVGVNYYIPAEDRYVEGKVVVDKDATTVDLAALTDIPEGYEVISTDAAQINDGWIYVELQQIVTTKEVGVNYYIPAEDRYEEGKVVVDKDATTVDPTTLTDIPEGYEVISTDAVQINDNWIYVELQQIVTTKEVGVNYYIPAEDRYVEGKVVVDKDATTVDPAALTDIPEGYEVISTDAAQINDGWIYVELQQIVTTKEVGVNYYIPAEDRYVEGKVVVDKDATTVDPTTLTDIPEGYEVISTDAVQINDNWIYVELQQIVTTKEVGVNYYIPAEDRYVEGKVVVDKDATTVDPAALTDIPEGYEVISTDAAQINDGWIYVELQQIVTTKEVGVNYYIPAEDRYVEGKVVVDKDATTVDPAALTDIPEGYEVISTDAAQINDGWIYVELQKTVNEAAATLQVNFVGEFGEDIGVAPVVVTKNGPEGETANFVYGEDWTLPEGYTFAADFDEAAATQTISVKYGETLNSLQIGIVPIQQEEPQEAVATLQVNFVGEFGEDIGVAPVVVTKNGPEGETANFVYGEDWTLPEGYTFAADFDEAAATQTISVKYGETLNSLQIGIVPIQQEEPQEAVATLQVNFVGEFGEDIGVAPVVVTKNGPEGETANFVYGEDWTLPEGYTFAADFDEAAATQTISVKYGETLNSLQIGIVPIQQEEPQEAVATLQVNFVGEFGEDIGVAPVVVTKNGPEGETANFVYGEDWTLPEGYTFAADFDEAAATQTISVKYGETLNSLQIGIVPIQQEEPQEAVATLQVNFVGEFGEDIGVAPVVVTKNGPEGETANFVYGEDWTLPEGYTFAADFDEAAATQTISVKYGETLNSLQIGIVPIQQEEPQEAVATLQVNFVGEFGEDIGVAPVVVTKNGPEGETANFVYGEDWTLPEGYTFAADFDEAAATQTISVKYGETLNSLQIGIVPIQQEEPQEAVATLQVNFVGEFGEDIGVAPVVVTKNGTAGEWANFVYGEDWTLPEGYTFAADFDEAAATQTISVKYGETLNSLQIGIVPIQQETVVESPEPAAETVEESAEPAAETVEESAEPAAETVEEIAEPTTEEPGNTEPVADGEETAAESAEPAAEVSDGAQSE